MKIRTIIATCARAWVLGAWCALLGAGCSTSGGRQEPSTDGYRPQYARLHWTEQPDIKIFIAGDINTFWSLFGKRPRSDDRMAVLKGGKIAIDMEVDLRTVSWHEGILEDWEVVLEGGKDYTLRFERSAAVADTARFIEVWIEEAGSGVPVTDKWIIGAGLW